MGKQTGIFKFTGKMGGVIGYKVGDEYYVRSAPEHVRQSEATKLSSRAFGKASTLGAAFRQVLNGMLDNPLEGSTVNRLNKALVGVLQADGRRLKRFVPAHFKRLKGFALNAFNSLADILTVTPAISRDSANNLLVTIPPMDSCMSNPSATHLCIKALAVHIQPGFEQATATASEAVLLPVGHPSGEIALVVPAQKGVVSCVMLEVSQCMEEQGKMVFLHNRQYTAVDVIAVLRGSMAKVKRKRPVVRRQAEVPCLPPGFLPRE